MDLQHSTKEQDPDLVLIHSAVRGVLGVLGVDLVVSQVEDLEPISILKICLKVSLEAKGVEVVDVIRFKKKYLWETVLRFKQTSRSWKRQRGPAKPSAYLRYLLVKHVLETV